MALDVIYWQENEGRRMALSGNILLPSFFCQSSGVSGQRAGRPEGGSVSSAVHPRRASRPRSRRDAQETAGGGFRGSMQATQPRGSRGERGEAFVRIFHPNSVSPDPFPLGAASAHRRRRWWQRPQQASVRERRFKGQMKRMSLSCLSVLQDSSDLKPSVCFSRSTAERSFSMSSALKCTS